MQVGQTSVGFLPLGVVARPCPRTFRVKIAGNNDGAEVEVEASGQTRPIVYFDDRAEGADQLTG